MVRCADCGLLAAKDNGSGELIEVDPRIRASDKNAIGAIETRSGYELMPVCSAGAANLQSELSNKTAKAVFDCIQRDRSCSSMTKWVEGHSPQWHLEMLNQESMLRFQAEQRDLERRQKEEERKWQEDQKEKERKWQESREEKDRGWKESQEVKSREWQESQNRHSRRTTVIVAIIGLAGALLAAALGTLLGYFLHSR